MNDLKNPSTLNRREFLKLAVTAAASLVAASATTAFTPPPKAGGPLPSAFGSLPGSKYRAPADGWIYISPDNGKTWQRSIYIGASYQVKNVAKTTTGWQADVAFLDQPITLLSQDGSTWRTSGYQSPSA